MIELFPYQHQGADWLTKAKFRLLADDMRLGKTAQTITAADAIDAKTITVLCPAVARINWEREFNKFSTKPRSISVILSNKDLKNAGDVRICSYDLAGKLPKRADDLMVLDECHYLKSTDAARTNVVLGKAGLVHRAARTWFLSGTPAPNHPGELWAMLYVAGVTKLTYEKFVDQFCVSYPSAYGRDGRRIVEGKNLKELKELMAPFMLRRTKAQVKPEMPPVLFSELVVPAGDVDLEINFFPQWANGPDGPAILKRQLDSQYCTAVNAYDQAVKDGRNPFPILEAIAEQTSLWRRYTGLQKVPGVVEKVAAELEAGAYRKIVIFAWHKAVIDRLREGLVKFDPVTLFGGTPAEKRQKNIDRFQNRGSCRVFIGQVLAAGTAIDLSAASNGLIVEPSWVPGENAQAAARMDGPNQKEQISMQIVSVAGAFDERQATVLLKIGRAHV